MAQLSRWILVSWVDSHCDNGWQDPRDVREEGHDGFMCESAGWLIEQNDRYVKLAMSRSLEKDGQLAEILRIPREAIKRVRTLVPGRAR